MQKGSNLAALYLKNNNNKKTKIKDFLNMNAFLKDG